MSEEQEERATSQERIEKVNQFWQGEEADLQAMFQRSNFGYLAIHEKEEILLNLPDLSGKKILDLASGIGRFTRHFSEKGRHLVSVDLVEKFVEKNMKDHADCGNVLFFCSDAMDLDFKEKSFDFIFVNWLFMFLEDEELDLLVDRICRWLAPGGELFLRESCEPMRFRSKKQGYYAYYRTPLFYEKLLKEKLVLFQEGNIQTWVDCFADPFQCFWRWKKLN